MVNDPPKADQIGGKNRVFRPKKPMWEQLFLGLIWGRKGSHFNDNQ
jgi:hypothetical protein